MAQSETELSICDEIRIDDKDFEDGKFYCPCPCGDKFQITLVSIIRDFLIYYWFITREYISFRFNSIGDLE